MSIFTRRSSSSDAIELNSIKNRPILNDQGEPMDDKELVFMAMDTIEKYEKETGMAAPVDPKFKQWVKDACDHVRNGGDIVQFKQMHIVRTIPDYSMLKNIAK